MLINADFLQPASIRAEQHQWVESPQGGVKRMMLDRIGAEKARATSLVRYAPQSYFPHHQHPGGEEILVLEGTFSADDTHYPAGWYLRNPPGSGHQPYSDEGALIFVKLRQMPESETRYVATNTNDASHWQTLEGREVCKLFSDDYEQVSLQRIKAGEPIFVEDRFVDGVANGDHAAVTSGGAEILVIDGMLLDAETQYQPQSWIRLPAGGNLGSDCNLIAGESGATIYIKTGHLLNVIGAA
ncbi:cupin domain-containing protein [Psychrobacter phenylpyruvicus]|uniref:Anti-sigma factor, putative, ChrR family n=1 Tax=Psychrobacter phenylpyruvicus TaxID=29432 RepID=A0A379LLB6_9GAMM|nr:cupin domain-containing protein [Psychrobacter phenylpyruvicus]SUD90687.1 anti-sigma factor, putative, ChrR family [Psychrobacter phenylpyruvicus]